MFSIENATKGIKTNVVVASEIIDKDDLQKVLENYPTNDQITKILNTITSITLPQLYYTKSQSDEKYSTKSHTHNTINNDLTVNGNVQVTSLNGFQLATSEGGKWDTKLYVPSIITLKEDGVVEVGQYIDMHNNADYDKDNTWRITANTNSLDFKSKTGSLLSFGSNGNIKCATINNVDITKIFSNDHNHDEIYAKNNHEHTNYASSVHTHSYNNLNDLTNIPTGSNTEDIHCSTIDGFALNPGPSSAFVDISVPSIAVIKGDGVLETGPYIDMHTSDGYETDYSWRIQCIDNDIAFKRKQGNGFSYSSSVDALGCNKIGCNELMYSVKTNGIDNTGNIKFNTGQFTSLVTTKLTLFHSIIEESGDTYQLLWRIYGSTPTAYVKYGRLYSESVTHKKQNDGTIFDTYSSIYYIATTFNNY